MANDQSRADDFASRIAFTCLVTTMEAAGVLPYGAVAKNIRTLAQECEPSSPEAISLLSYAVALDDMAADMRRDFAEKERGS